MTERRIGILLCDGVEELDAVGPYEVLAAWTLMHPEDRWSVACLSGDGRPVTAAEGLVIGAHGPFDDAPLDLVLHPGRRGTRPLTRDASHLDRLRRHRDAGALLTSVCTGSLVYAAAGFLIGRPATTHWSAYDELRALDPTVDLQPDARWVDDGDVVTSAGVSAGIDTALHLVARLVDEDRAREVRREIQYDPEPV